MSRIGRMSIKIPNGVECRLEGDKLKIKGQKGIKEAFIPANFKVEMEDKSFKISPKHPDKELTKKESMLHGTTCRLVANMMKGVSEGFEKDLQLVGVGYRAEIQGSKTLKLSLGYSHDIFYPIPDDITIIVDKQTLLKVQGIDKQRVGQIASEIIRFRPPEPYKGKGVRVVGQYLRMKEGKK